MTYDGDKIRGSYIYNDNTGQVYTGGKPFSDLFSALSTIGDNFYVQGKQKEAEQVSELSSLMYKFQDLAMENYYKKDSGFTIEKALVFESKFSKKFESGTISCSGKCYVGSSIGDNSWFNVAIKNSKLNFINSNERKITFFAANSYLASYQSNADMLSDNKYIIIEKSKKSDLSYFVKKQKSGITFSNTVTSASYKANGQERNNELTELFSKKVGCLIPSAEYADGLDIIQHRVNEEGKNYFDITVPNYYCQEEVAGLLYYIPEFPSASEINSLASLIETFLSEGGTIPEIPKKTTVIASESRNVNAIMCQTRSECLGLIA